MGLEIRKRKDGTIIRHWYGSYRDSNGRRKIEPLKTPLPKKEVIPTPLSSLGSPAFEASRARAQKELDDCKTEARQKGRADHLVERLIEAKTGSKVEYAKLADLPALWRGIDREGGAPSEKHLAWCDSVFKRFADAVPCEFLYEVKPDHIKTFLDGLRKTHTHKTIKDMTTVIRAALTRLLPVGAENPFGKTIRKRRASGASETGDTVARRPLTLEQLERLYETARPDPLLYPLAVCAACTGMRIGDVCTLRWQSVDLRAGWVRVATSKTGVVVEVPIFDRLRDVLEQALADREPGAVYVWPEAARMYGDETGNGNPTRNGLYYRGKALFARALADHAENAPERPALASEQADLAEDLPRVAEAVGGAGFADAKRDRIIDTLTRYARGDSYRKIEAETGRCRALLSQDLAEAERVCGLRLRPGASVKTGRDIKTLIEATRQRRKVGRHAASLLGWHNLRGTFVTLALGAGVPFETVAKCTGHTLAKTMRDHYYNPTREHTRQAMQKVGALLSGKAARRAIAEPKADPLAVIAAQLGQLTREERERLAEMLAKKGTVNEGSN